MQSEYHETHSMFDRLDALPKTALILSDALTHPFYNQHFLNTLEITGCVTGNTGWKPKHLTGNNETLVVPGYEKEHSYGEYIFDWDIADQLSRAGFPYYPKWVSQLPFTPVQWPEENESTIAGLAQILNQEIQMPRYFSYQLLYYQNDHWRTHLSGDWVQRRSIYFRWDNQDFSCFTDFLQSLTRKRAKNIRQERQKLQQQSLRFQTITGDQLTKEHIELFFQFYRSTYLKKSGHTGYLSQTFFIEWLLTIKQNALFVFSYHDDAPVAAALFLFDDDTLYGRYWGGLPGYQHLHFEVCYYQGIEFCIKQKLKYFDPGVQGEHKVTRGFQPRLSASYYFYAHKEINQSVKQAFDREALGIEQYRQQLLDKMPFK